jgi:hypothetical protein
VDCVVTGNPDIAAAARAAGLEVVSKPEALEGVWPGVQMGQGGQAAPTGPPWVDSNGWRLRLERARKPGEAPLVAADPPAENPFLRPSSYALAMADAFAHGGRWLVTLTPKLASDLAAKTDAAIDNWKTIAAALAFFHARRDWHSLAPVCTVGVLSSFAGEDADHAGELLNLLARRGVGYRVLLRDRPAALEGLRAVVFADHAVPEPAQQRKLMAFVEAGGLLLAPANWPVKPAASAGLDTYRRFQLFRAGKGRLAVSTETVQDPYLVAGDAQLLLSHRHAPVKLFNAGTLMWNYTRSDNRAVLHIVNYAMRSFGHPVSLALAHRYKSARIATLEGAPAALELHPAAGGVEIHLPRFGVYAAIELEA